MSEAERPASVAAEAPAPPANSVSITETVGSVVQTALEGAEKLYHDAATGVMGKAEHVRVGIDHTVATLKTKASEAGAVIDQKTDAAVSTVAPLVSSLKRKLSNAAPSLAGAADAVKKAAIGAKDQVASLATAASERISSTVRGAVNAEPVLAEGGSAAAVDETAVVPEDPAAKKIHALTEKIREDEKEYAEHTAPGAPDPDEVITSDLLDVEPPPGPSGVFHLPSKTSQL